MFRRPIAVLFMAAMLFSSVGAVEIDGFVQGLYGGRVDRTNPTVTEMTASETRFQLRAADYGDNGEFFTRLDFVWDGADSSDYDWELREAYVKFRMGDNIDFKIGRQILTWGTGDLLFINDVFAKDYQSFFIGRTDQYLKAPQSSLRMEYYSSLGELAIIWTPRFEANRLPTGRRLSFFDPIAGEIVGEPAVGTAPLPTARFKKSELSLRFRRQVGPMSAAAYFYRGFYKSPLGFDPVAVTPVYPKLNVYGGSVRGSMAGGIFWLEAGYFDSRDDANGDNPFAPNSTILGLSGYERQVATNLTANLQWQITHMTDYDTYEAQQIGMGSYARDEFEHLITSRITKLVYSELVNLSGFVFYSPTAEDIYVRLSSSYKYSDQIDLTVGANIFDGNSIESEFGQLQKNDNVYGRITYGF